MEDDGRWQAEVEEKEQQRDEESKMKFHSDDISELAAALSKAQGEITGARKESTNPFFKSKYADLASVWDACREHLSANGLAVVQTTENTSEPGVLIVTTLIHSSGQWIRGELLMAPVKNDPQGIGSTITYGRRYGLAAITGVAQVDDDAESATRSKVNPEPIRKAYVDRAVSRYKDIVDADTDEIDAQAIKDINAKLTNDERLAVASALGNDKPKDSNKMYRNIVKEVVSSHKADQELPQ